MAQELPDSAQVVVIGGGVIGTSIAFHLAEAGVPEVLVLERDGLGEGSTSKAAGGVRGQFADATNIALAARSLGAFEQFPQRPGQEIDLQQVGYLFLLSRAEDVAAFEQAITLQNRHGVPSRLITVEEALQLSPLVHGEGLLAAAFSPSDGHCTPDSVVQGYAAGARRFGARLVTRCAARGIAVEGGRITSVVTDRGAVRTSTVVCSAGAWSAAVGDMAGVDLPVSPMRRQILVTEPITDLPENLPMTIDFTTSFYFHREGPGLLIGMSDPDERPGFDLRRTDTWLPRLSEAIAHRAPSLSGVGIATGWAGLYEQTPDHNALIGEAGELPGFFYATGFSGHGFLQGPAVGEVVRDLVLGREPFIDVSPLSADRFANDETRPERYII
ncbi:MAG TPA: FAD-binding oxidoreductase [Jatrophihabitans sp.]|nr:FAD-binding oxidoreductase [Jatrophihabitans sp.]